MNPPIPIARPCQADWNVMNGDERQRLCSQCQKHVHNLSALTHRELQNFITQRKGDECIGYAYDEKGRLLLATRWSWIGRLWRRVCAGAVWVLAGLLPTLFGGCAASRGDAGGRGPGGLGKTRVMPGAPMPIERKARTNQGQILLGEVCPPEASKPTGKK